MTKGDSNCGTTIVIAISLLSPSSIQKLYKQYHNDCVACQLMKLMLLSSLSMLCATNKTTQHYAQVH